ncbi:MAG TPA: mechanosensitive ion channel domain-containing protein [Stellaceae bacterium]|nr:mechanosensitive ion channel domain-containing protein [Stellaceae bacterium]
MTARIAAMLLLATGLLAAVLPRGGLAGTAAAQSATPPAAPAPTAAPAPVTAAELQRLVNTLQDDAQRARLVEELRGLIAAQRGVEAQPQEASPVTLLEQISQRTEAISQEVLAAAAVVVDVPRIVGWVKEQVVDPVLRAFWLDVGLKLLTIFGLALVAEWLMRRVLLRPRRSLTNGNGHLPLRLALMAARAVLDALPILTFAAVAYIILPFVGARFATERVATTLIGAYVTARLIAGVARIVLLPRLGPPLFPRLKEETRSYLYVWAKRFIYWTVYGYAITAGAWWLGVPGGIYALLLKSTALVLAVLAIIFVLQNRVAVRDWLQGRKANGGAAEGGGAVSGWRVLRNRLADTWHVLAITYISAIFLVYALRVNGGFIYVLRGTLLTLAVLVVARLIVNLTRRVSRHGFAISSELRQKFPTLEQRANRYVPIFSAVIAALVYAFAALAILQAWNVAAFSWLDSDFGHRVTTSLISIGTVILIALAVWELFSSAIERYLTAVDQDDVPLARSARARTLLPLLRTAMMVLILLLVSLIILSQVGVDIAPLLAGAGVVGLAIGFGSQALVKDVITGLFILIEDTLAVGDVVDVGKGHLGVVEAISIRTIRLRDNAGAIHAIPFSEVSSVINLTKDYAYYVSNVAVSYREDPDRVAAVLREVAGELMRDAAFRPFILEPLEVIGIDKMTELGITIQSRLKTLPRKQWMVGREFVRRMKQAFDRDGIEMPYAVKPRYLEEMSERVAEAAKEAAPREVKSA